MKKVKQFDRTTCKVVSNHMRTVLEKEAQKFGLSFGRGNGTFGDGTFSFKITFTTQDEDGNAQSKEAKNFLEYAELIDMKKEHLNQEFTCGSIRYRLEGYKPRSPKLPFVCRNLHDMKLYKLSTVKVKKGLGLDVTLELAMENDLY